MLCPRCKANELKESKTDKGVKLDVCTQCRGIWFDKGELQRFLQDGLKDLTIPTGAGPAGLQCPKCRTPLANFDYPGTRVGVDACKKCGGVWLDGGEFGKIKAVRKAILAGQPPPQGAARQGFLGRILSIFKRKPKT